MSDLAQRIFDDAAAVARAEAERLTAPRQPVDPDGIGDYARAVSAAAMGNRVQGHADLPPAVGGSWAQLQHEHDAVAQIYDLDEGDINQWWLDECHDAFRELVFACGRGTNGQRKNACDALREAINRGWRTCITGHLGDDALNPSGMTEENDRDEQRLTAREVGRE